MALTNCTLAGNGAITDIAGSYANGGGLDNYYGAATLTNCILSGNTVKGGDADGSSYAYYTYGGSAGGGGLYNFGTLTLTGCTLSANSAQGGIGSGLNSYPDSSHEGGISCSTPR